MSLYRGKSFKKDLGDLEEAEAAIEEVAPDSASVEVPADPPRRYQAVDSGVILAGPSRGDDSLDTAPTKHKGKGRALEIIADIHEEEEEELEVFVSEEPVAVVKSEKRHPMGYGSIERAAPEGQSVACCGPLFLDSLYRYIHMHNSNKHHSTTPLHRAKGHHPPRLSTDRACCARGAEC
jgi:hypothetical protein